MISFDMDIKENFAQFYDDRYAQFVFVDSMDGCSFNVRVGSLQYSRPVGVVVASTTVELNKVLAALYTSLQGEWKPSGKSALCKVAPDKKVVRADLIEGYMLRVEFNDGHYTEVDFEPFLMESSHPTITGYRNRAKFAGFQVVDGNVNWDDYSMIFPIEDLYGGCIR